MAKRQTRRSLSVCAESYTAFKVFCQAHNVSLGQAVEQLIAMTTRGEVKLKPGRNQYALGFERQRLRQGHAPLSEHESLLDVDNEPTQERKPVAPVIKLPTGPAPVFVTRDGKRVVAKQGICAICAESALVAPSVDAGETINVCDACEHEPPTSSRYSFGGSASSRGYAEGCGQASTIGKRRG